MKYQSGKTVKVIAESTPQAFADNLNAEMKKLSARKAQYELQFNNNMGYCAYLVIEESVPVPECLEDEFELIGEKYHCVQCPLWVHPTKGNVKYTRCSIAGGIRGANSPCCEEFYKRLLNGEIEVEEA